MRFVTFVAVALSIFLITDTDVTAAGGGGGGGGGGISSSGPSVNIQQLYKNGFAHLQAGEYKDAQRDFKKILRVVPDEAQTNYLMGLAKVGEQNHKGSIRYFRAAVKKDRKMYQAYEQMGRAYLAQGKLGNAQKQLDKLDKALAKCGNKCEREKLEGARNSLKAAIDSSGTGDQQSFLMPSVRMPVTAPEEAYVLAVSHINGGRFDVAITILNDLIVSNGPHADVYNYLGFASRKLGYFDTAVGYYRMALGIDPDHRGAHEYLGELYVHTGQRARAAKQLDQLARLCPFGCAEYDALKDRINAIETASH